MYNKNNIAIAKIASKTGGKLETVAFYGNKTVATDSFRLIEMSAQGEAHPRELRSAEYLRKMVKLKKKETIELDQIPYQKTSFEDDFPETDTLINTHFANVNDTESYTSIKINAEYLEELLGILKHMNVFKSVTLSVPKKGYSPILLEAEDKEQKARALLMPINK